MIIVAVSGGVDSMVLLDKLYHDKQKIVIAHVNYQKRKESYQDALLIKEYIADKDIIFEQLIVNEQDYTNENFQVQARLIRYDFFKEVALKYQTNQVYVAHHKDDFIETYTFKKERKGLYSYLGIKQETEYQGLVIKRPLLSLYKYEIIEYANKNNVPFLEDCSNATLDYERNRIRAKLDKLTLIQKDQLIELAFQENKDIALEEQFVKSKLHKIIKVDEFLSFSENQQRRWLYYQLKKVDISQKHIDEIIRKIGNTNNFSDTFLDTTIAKAYDIIYILDKMPSIYEFQIENELDKEKLLVYFKENYNYEVEDMSSSYPFKIRSILKEDYLALGIDYKKFRRKLIKDKVPFFIRDYLPVLVENNQVKKIL